MCPRDTGGPKRHRWPFERLDMVEGTVDPDAQLSVPIGLCEGIRAPRCPQKAGRHEGRPHVPQRSRVVVQNGAPCTARTAPDGLWALENVGESRKHVAFYGSAIVARHNVKR